MTFSKDFRGVVPQKPDSEKIKMKKKTLGSILNRAFEEAGEEGLVPSYGLRGHDINWDQVRQSLSKWEAKGKIICLERRNPINLSRYVLTKYSQPEN